MHTGKEWWCPANISKPSPTSVVFRKAILSIQKPEYSDNGTRVGDKWLVRSGEPGQPPVCTGRLMPRETPPAFLCRWSRKKKPRMITQTGRRRPAAFALTPAVYQRGLVYMKIRQCATGGSHWIQPVAAGRYDSPPLYIKRKGMRPVCYLITNIGHLSRKLLFLFLIKMITLQSWFHTDMHKIFLIFVLVYSGKLLRWVAGATHVRYFKPPAVIWKWNWKDTVNHAARTGHSRYNKIEQKVKKYYAGRFWQPSRRNVFMYSIWHKKLKLFTPVKFHGKNSGGIMPNPFLERERVSPQKPSLGFFVTEKYHQGKTVIH